MRLAAPPLNAALLAALFALAAALTAPAGAKAENSSGPGWHPRADLREDVRDRREDHRDRLENRADRREDVRDRREDYRDARHDGGWRDRIEGRWDRNHGRGHAYGYGPRLWSHARLDHRGDRRDAHRGHGPARRALGHPHH